MIDNKSPIGIIGAGVMGRGIAQLFAQAGYPTRLHDTDPTAAQAAADFIRQMVQRQVAKGLRDEQEAAATMARLVVCRELAELSDCQILIEAVVENLEVKKRLFAELEKIAPAPAILASNTSSLLISDIAAVCADPGRIAGLHFFNPAPLMKVVEVVPGALTRQDVVEALTALVASTGHRAVVAADQPGFIVNHAGRGLVTEALRILEEGVAAPHDIDLIMRESLGFRMGPFELLDLTGLDVSGKVMQSVYEQFHQDPLFRPSSLVAPRVAAGLFGRKTGAGFYRYSEGRKIEPEAEPAPPVSLTKAWLAPSCASELTTLLQANGAEIAATADAEDAMLVLQPWGQDLSDACAELNLDPARAVAVDPLPPLSARRALMLSPVTTTQVRDSMRGLLAADGVPVTVINDSPGFVSQRIAAMIVNIAGNIAQRRIATVPDLEDAVVLGLGYPLGPLSWGDKIGGARIADILDNLFRLTHDPRYRSNPWVRRRAQAGASLLTEEAPRA